MLKYFTILVFAIMPPLTACEINQLTEKEKADGWQLLFNGKDLNGWQTFVENKPPASGWKVENGLLRKLHKVTGKDIITTDQFEDFILSWEWKVAEKGNNGIKYLVLESRKRAPGLEYQMLDDEKHPDAKNGKKRLTASLYDIMIADTVDVLKPANEWNFSRIIVDGKYVEHWLNGKMVLDYELGSEALKAAVANSKFKKAPAFGEKNKGHIMLTDHSDACDFRNIKIKPLTKKP